MRRRHILMAALATASRPAAAQEFPNRPVTLIVPFPAGGSVDMTCRTLAVQLSRSLGQPVITDFRAGAGGTIGADAVAKAPADGHTLLFLSTSHTIGQALYPKLPYDVVRDFAPVALFVANPHVLVVHPDVPARNVAEFVALSRSRPGTLNYASAGNGTSAHIVGELFRQATGADLTHIPYRGSAGALSDVVAGHVQAMFEISATAIPHVRAGRLRALAVSSTSRSPALPEVPSMAEAGLAGFEYVGWGGIAAPAGTPQAVVARIEAAIAEAGRDPQLLSRYADVGVDFLFEPAVAYGARIRRDTARFAELVRARNLRID